MSQLDDITDEDFVPFLKNLEVETYNKSFEWLLSDPEVSGVLRWIYENLDVNNALTGREECRFAELEKAGCLLPPEDLEYAISELQCEYEGICLPGNQDSLEDIKMEIQMDNERLHMLEKQEVTMDKMIQRNIDIKKDLNIEITKLEGIEHQLSEEESNIGKNCMQLANQVETITRDVICTVRDTLETVSNCQHDVEKSRKFLAFGPIEQYKQTKALFRSHIDLYVTKRLKNTENNIVEEEILRELVKAKNLEGRLSDAVSAYIENQADLTGERAKLAFLANYAPTIYPSDHGLYTMEISNVIEMLEKESSILEQKLQEASKILVSRRTALAEESAAKSAIKIRLQMQNDLKWLSSITQEALVLDRLLYYVLRRELASVQELWQFAADLKDFVTQEKDTVCSRIQSMKDICADIINSEAAEESQNTLLFSISSLLGVQSDGKTLVDVYKEVRNRAQRLRADIVEVIKEKDRDLDKIKSTQTVLSKYIWDGCTRAPNCYWTDVSALSYKLVHESEDVDALIKATGTRFANVKSGDKQQLRKLWQWFLTDPAKLLSAMEKVY